MLRAKLILEIEYPVDPEHYLDDNEHPDIDGLKERVISIDTDPDAIDEIVRNNLGEPSMTARIEFTGSTDDPAD